MRLGHPDLVKKLGKPNSAEAYPCLRGYLEWLLIPDRADHLLEDIFEIVFILANWPWPAASDLGKEFASLSKQAQGLLGIGDLGLKDNIMPILEDLERQQLGGDYAAMMREIVAQIGHTDKALARSVEDRLCTVNDMRAIVRSKLRAVRDPRNSPWAICFPENFDLYFQASETRLWERAKLQRLVEFAKNRSADNINGSNLTHMLLGDLSEQADTEARMALKQQLEVFIRQRAVLAETRKEMKEGLDSVAPQGGNNGTATDWIGNLLKHSCESSDPKLTELTRLVHSFEKRIFQVAAASLRRLGRTVRENYFVGPRKERWVVNDTNHSAPALVKLARLGAQAMDLLDADEVGRILDYPYKAPPKRHEKGLAYMLILRAAVTDLIERLLEVDKDYRSKQDPNQESLLIQMLREAKGIFGPLYLVRHFTRGDELRREAIWERCGITEATEAREGGQHVPRVIEEAAAICLHKVQDKLKTSPPESLDPLLARYLFFVVFYLRMLPVVESDKSGVLARLVPDLMGQSSTTPKILYDHFVASALYPQSRIRHTDGGRAATTKGATCDIRATWVRKVLSDNAIEKMQDHCKNAKKNNGQAEVGPRVREGRAAFLRAFPTKLG